MDDLIQTLRMLVCETDVLGMYNPADDDERERLAVAVAREVLAVAGRRSDVQRFADSIGIPAGYRPAARERIARLVIARSARPPPPPPPRRFARIGGKFVRMIAV
jgi:hypothetical protein